MITDALLAVLAAFLSVIGALLPTTTLVGIPTSISNLAATIGSYAGPLNPWFPAVELFTFLVVVLLYWLPAVLVYQLIFWIYKHIPIVGAG